MERKNSYPNENILLFQQIQYRCSNPDPDVKFDIPNNCEGKGLGLLEDYTDIAILALGPARTFIRLSMVKF